MIDFKVNLAIALVICNALGCMGECQMSIQDVDHCALRGMFFGNREAIIPSNDNEMQEQCKISRDAVKCLTDFEQHCLDGFPQTIFRGAIGRASKNLERRCDKADSRADFVEHVKCFLPRERMEPFHICSDKNLAMLEKLKEVDLGDRLSAHCCIFSFFRDCFHRAATRSCSPENVQYWENVLNEWAEDSPTFNCDGYDSLANCDKSLKPEVWNKLKEVANSDDPTVMAARHKYGSGIPLSLELLNEFKS